MQLRESGVPGLDGQLSGGLVPGQSIIVLSASGNAPFRFLEHFAAAGLQTGEMVYYYNLERPKPEVLARMDRLVPTEGPRSNLEYIDCYSVKLRDLDMATMERIGVQNHAPKITDDLVRRVLDHPRDVPFRVVIESLSESIDAYGLDATLTMLKVLVGVVKMRGGLLAALLVKGIHDPQVEARVSHIVDGVFEFGRERQGFGTYSFLNINKLRGIVDAERLLLYKETEHGLRLETTRRVF